MADQILDKGNNSGAKKKKPLLNFWDIWNMSFGFLGIQMGFGLQIGNTSRIFETLGADVSDLAIYWLAGPVTGLIVQPIIGYFSDRTWSPRWGRRRPYFMIGALLAMIAMLFMPNSPVLWISIGMLWIMDSSFNIAMEPFRAFVGDNLPSEQRTMGFAMQSFFIGLGAVIASLLPYMLDNWFGVSNTADAGVIPDTVKYSFYFGAIAFFLAVAWTVFKSFEYPPEELHNFEGYGDEESVEAKLTSDVEYISNGNKHIFGGGIALIIGAIFAFLVYSNSWSRDLYVLSIGVLMGGGALSILSGLLSKGGSYNNFFVTMVNDIQFMPKTMKQLAIVQFFSWFALFAMWIYTNSAVTEYMFGTTDPQSDAYNEGANWASLSFGVYNGVAALVAFLLPVLARKTSRKFTHMICLFIGGVGLASIYFLQSKTGLMVAMVGVGFAWSSIISMPYAILAGALPAKKMGYYMGVFNFFIVIPQIVAASILGFILSQFFSGSSIHALLVGGVAMIVAGVLTMLVNDKDEVVNL